MTCRSVLAALVALAAPFAGQAAERVVVAGGDLTEILYALGDEAIIAGVDSTSNFPPEATALPQIGYVRNLAAEGVLSLSPDLLLGAYDAGPAAVLQQIESAGVPVKLAPHEAGPAGVAAKIRFVGEAIGREEAAEALATKVETRFAEIEAKVMTTLEERPRVLFVLAIRDGAPLVGGDGTGADEIIRLAGGTNAAAGVKGYQPMSREALIAAAPDAILMMSGRAHAAGGLDAVFERPDVALTPAGQAKRGFEMDGMLLLGFGPRSPEAAAELARLIHGEAAAAAAGL